MTAVVATEAPAMAKGRRWDNCMIAVVAPSFYREKSTIYNVTADMIARRWKIAAFIYHTTIALSLLLATNLRIIAIAPAARR